MMASTKLALRRRGLIVGAGACLLSGCFGSFGATNALYEWNKGVSDSKWLRWLVFLVFVILPVYGLFILADALVLNTIEFFSGNNPVGHAELGKGRELRTSRTADASLVKHEILERGKVVHTLYMRLVSKDTLLVLDEHMHVIGRAHKREDGSVEVRDAGGHVVSEHSAREVTRAEAALDNATPSGAVATVARLPAGDASSA